MRNKVEKVVAQRQGDRDHPRPERSQRRKAKGVWWWWVGVGVVQAGGVGCVCVRCRQAQAERHKGMVVWGACMQAGTGRQARVGNGGGGVLCAGRRRREGLSPCAGTHTQNKVLSQVQAGMVPKPAKLSVTTVLSCSPGTTQKQMCVCVCGGVSPFF